MLCHLKTLPYLPANCRSVSHRLTVLSLNTVDLHQFMVPFVDNSFNKTKKVCQMERSAIVSVVLMFALLLAAGPVFAQHFVLDPTNGDTHTLFVASATIAGDDLIENDEIGVFTTAGTVRGLAVVEENGAIPEITVFGQGDEDGGFTDGEIMAFKIWDASAEEEMTAFVSGGAIITFTANDADAISLEVLDQHFLAGNWPRHKSGAA